MRKISLFLFKIYPVLFLLDGIISAVDDISIFMTASNYFHGVRMLLANIVLFGGVAYFFNLFFIESRHRQKYFWLVAYNFVGSIFSMWNLMRLIRATSLFEVFALEVDSHSVMQKYPAYFIVQLIFSIIQILVGLYVLKFHRQDSPMFRDKVRFILAPVSAFILLSFHLLLPVISVPMMLVNGTGGFLGLAGANVTSIEKVYQKGDKTLHLIPMVHIGDEAFYKELSIVDGKHKTLYLLEGVKDKDELLKNLDYGKFAEGAKLDLQKDHFNPQAPAELQKNISYIVADIDVSEFEPETRTFLKKVFEQLNTKSFFEIMTMESDSFSARESATLIVDLIEKRNERVIQELKKNEPDFREIYIPWGAAHMPEIERAVLKLGYKNTEEKERVVISLNNILNKLSKK